MNLLQQYAQAQGSPTLWSLDEFVQVVNRLLPQVLPDAAHAGSDESNPASTSGGNSSGKVLDEVNPRLVRHYTTLGLLDKPERQGREARYGYRHLLQLLMIRRLLGEGYSSIAIDRLMAEKSNSDLEALLQGDVRLTVQAVQTAQTATAQTAQTATAQTENPALTFLQRIQSPSSIVRARSSAVNLPACSVPDVHTPDVHTLASPASVPVPDHLLRSRSAPKVPQNQEQSLGDASPAPPAPGCSVPGSPVQTSPMDAPIDSPIQQWLRIPLLPGLELHVREDFVFPSTPAEQQSLLQRLFQLILETLTTLTRR